MFKFSLRSMALIVLRSWIIFLPTVLSSTVTRWNRLLTLSSLVTHKIVHFLGDDKSRLASRDGATHAKLPLSDAGLPYIRQMSQSRWKVTRFVWSPVLCSIIRFLNKRVPIGRSNGYGNDWMGTRLVQEERWRNGCQISSGRTALLTMS